MQMKGKSKLSKTKPDKDSTMSSPTCVVQLTLPLFATAEFQALSNETTSIDKSCICDNSTQTQKLFLTSVRDSTLKEKVSFAYWTDFCGEISSRLLLPVGTDYADLDSRSFSIWSNKTVEKSWYSTKLYIAQVPNSQPIFSASSMSSLAECTDSENIVKKSKKIQISITTEQKQIIKQWFGVSRYVFNQTIEYLQQPETKANWKAIKTGILNNLPEWCKKVPYQIKSIAIKDACTAVSNAKKKYKQTGVIQQVKFRSRRDRMQSSYIPKSAVSEIGIYRTVLGKIHYTEALPKKLGDCRLVRHLGCYYLAVPHELPRTISEKQGRVVAIDPGVRTFATMFSETSFGAIGDKDIGRIQRLCYYLDNLISRSTKTTAKTRYRYRKAMDRIRRKIRNLIDEVHHKLARFLVDNYDVILLPTFETSEMVLKNSRKIRSKSARQMLTWAHYRFKTFLKHKAFETGKLVIDCCEAYTSKTVSWTGEIKHNLGGASVIKSADGQAMLRDLNGARGIFLRALVDSPSLKNCIC
jgi:putative transposase